MSSQRAKELRALALSLSLVNDDLKMKRYLRKSEFYKESDRYKREREARKLAALNLAKELSSRTPTISAALINAVHNAPVEIVGHGGDEEIKEGDIRTSLSPADNIQDKSIVGTIDEVKELSKGLSDKAIQDVLKNLFKTPEEKVESKKDKGLSDAIYSEIIDRKIDGVYDNFNNAVDLSEELLQKASKSQLIRLQNRYREIDEGDEDDVPTSADAGNIINQHLDIIDDRLEKMEKQEKAEAELKSRARPTKPKLTRKATPPAGPPPPSSPKKRGRPKEIDIIKSILRDRLASAVDVDLNIEKETLKKFNDGIKLTKNEYFNLPLDLLQKLGGMNADEFSNYRRRIKSSKKPLPTIELEDVEDIMKKPSRPKLTDEQRAVLLAPILQQQTQSQPKTLTPKQLQQIASEDTPVIEGQGLKDYMDYMKGKRPTKDMKKLILLIGSQRAGNNSYKLKVEIEKLMNKIKTDLEEKIRKNKSKSAKQQVKAIEQEKRKLLIRQAAKRQLMEENRLITKN
jgi:hypothetical protein